MHTVIDAGDCEDIEVLSEVASVDKAALKSTINSINPKGKTPITSSINTALDMVDENGNTSLVLISDGLETCGLDPCSAVRQAKETGVPFVLHVVGFDVASEDTTQLECAAQAGGGLFFSANNAPELSDALQTAYEKPTIPDGRLIIGATADGALQDAIVRVETKSTGEHVAGGRTYVSADTNPRQMPIDDGSYTATVQAVGVKGTPTFSFDFEIVDGSQVERTFDFSAGEIVIKVTRNGELSDAVVSVLRKGERTNVAGGRTYATPNNNPKTIKLAAGTYDVKVKSVEIRNAPEPLFEDVVVNGSAQTPLEHNFESGELGVEVRRGDTLVDSVVAIIDASGKNVGGGRTYTSASSNPKRMTLVAGDYVVRVSEVRGERRETTATVTTGESSSIVVDLDQP